MIAKSTISYQCNLTYYTYYEIFIDFLLRTAELRFVRFELFVFVIIKNIVFTYLMILFYYITQNILRNCVRLIPIVLFVTVESCNLCHFFVCKGEVKDADVLLYVVGIAGARDSQFLGFCTFTKNVATCPDFDLISLSSEY